MAVNPTDTDRRLAEILERLQAAPPHVTLERHGSGFAFFSMRGQPIIPGRPAGFANEQHGWQIAYGNTYDTRMWPPLRELLAHAQDDLTFLLDLVQTLSRPSSPPSSPDTTLDLSCSAPVSEGGSGEGGRYPVGRWIKVVSQIPELNVRPCTYSVAPPSSHPPPSGEPRALESSDGGRDSGALSADKIAAEVALIDLAHATDRIAKAIPYLVRLEKRLQIDLWLFDDADLAREALAHLWGQK